MPGIVKLITKLMAIRTTIPLASRRSRLATTNHAPNKPKMAPEAPTDGKFGATDVVEEHRAAKRAHQVHDGEAHAAERQFERRANHHERPHVEQDVQRGSGVQERAGDEPVVLIVRHPDQLAAECRVSRQADQREIVDDLVVGQLGQIDSDVQGDEYPRDTRTGRDCPAAKDGPGPRGGAAAFTYALDALLPDWGAAEAVWAGVAAAAHA